ncbi:hypothetical protein HHK36_028985 [Tetracentron sinense]|uniref:TIR domain-containing protein n=1 Tax=Tetracentron sinense TaxID=13715 RepID=A0A834YID6_TETSI|nr:hypothetical protein HHK36_028985 [Tetracentron sinense]
MKIAFPDTDLREVRNAVSFSGPGATSALSPRQATLGQSKRHKMINEVEPDLSPSPKLLPRGPISADEDMKTRSQMVQKESRLTNSSGREQGQPGEVPLLTHPGELVICKKKRKDREKSAVKPRIGPVSPPSMGRNVRSPCLSPGPSLGSVQKDVKLSQQAAHQQSLYNIRCKCNRTVFCNLVKSKPKPSQTDHKKPAMVFLSTDWTVKIHMMYFVFGLGSGVNPKLRISRLTALLYSDPTVSQCQIRALGSYEDGCMDLRQESSKVRALPTTTSRNLSSSSSAFVSACQSPPFSPRSPTCQQSESTRSDIPNSCNNFLLSIDPLSSSTGIQNPEHLPGVRFAPSNISPSTVVSSDIQNSAVRDHVSSSTGIGCTSSSYNHGSGNGQLEKQKKGGRSHRTSFIRTSVSISSNRHRSCDVYIGFHGCKLSLLRFTNWLCAEFEVQGVSCFATDRARCRNSRNHGYIERAMAASTFGVVIVTRKSFGNPYSIEELRFFSGKKNLVPIFFDLDPGDCLARDITEKRGELWEKHGGELWMLYGGLEREWKEAVDGLLRVEEWKLEAQDGRWRDCILRTVTLLAARLGRRSVVDRVTRWREKVEKEEFPFPRNENFIGRKKELSELEFILFGDASGDAQREYFELKTRHKRKNLVIGRSVNSRVEERARDRQTESHSSKGKYPVVWKESEKEIEMQRVESTQRQYQPLLAKNGGRYGRRKRSMRILCGKGIACVSGDSGIGKTELLLEFAYKNSQRYKMILWVGGESRYIRQNYLNLWSFLEVDVGIENQCPEKNRIKSFEEQEEGAISRVRKELMRNIPFLVVIDNLESEKDWWDQKFIMDLLPRFGGETHFIISTRLHQVMNLEPLKLSYLSGVEAMSLMKGSLKDYPIAEIEALRIIEEKLGRLTLGLGIIGAILSELPINPSRLLDSINRMPVRNLTWSGREGHTLRKYTFFLQLLEVCFSIFDHADGPWSLATRMVQVGGWFAPGPTPISLLALAAHKIPEKHHGTRLWKRCLHTLTCGFTSSHTKRSEAEAYSMLVRFGIVRSSTKQDCVHFNELIKLYACNRGFNGVSQAMVEAVSCRGSISQHSEHLWAACFLLLGFGNDPVVVELKVSELLFIVKQVVLPLAIRTFMTFSRCNSASELLRLCTDALEAAEQSFVSPVERCLNRSLCWKAVQTNAQLNPGLWQELVLMRATVLETRTKLMLKGGQYDIAADLIRKVVFVRTSIHGEHHPDTISARETLSRLTRLLTNVQTS